MAATTLPKRVLFVYPSEGIVKNVSRELQQRVSEVVGIRNIVFDCVRDGYEGLQLFERNDYHAVLVTKDIGKTYPKMKGIEFLKIARLMREEQMMCPAIMVLGPSDDEATFLSRLDPKDKELVTKTICKHTVRVNDFAFSLREIFFPPTDDPRGYGHKSTSEAPPSKKMKKGQVEYARSSNQEEKYSAQHTPAGSEVLSSPSDTPFKYAHEQMAITMADGMPFDELFSHSELELSSEGLFSQYEPTASPNPSSEGMVRHSGTYEMDQEIHEV